MDNRRGRMYIPRINFSHPAWFLFKLALDNRDWWGVFAEECE